MHWFSEIRVLRYPSEFRYPGGQEAPHDYFIEIRGIQTILLDDRTFF